jgi:hypothetical protein
MCAIFTLFLSHSHTTPHSITLPYTALQYTIHYTTPHHTTLHYTALQVVTHSTPSTAMQRPPSQTTASQSKPRRCVCVCVCMCVFVCALLTHSLSRSPHYTALHHATLHCTTPRHTTQERVRNEKHTAKLQNMLSTRGLVCGWDLVNVKYPSKVLYCSGEPTCLGSSDNKGHVMLAGMASGSVAVWDTREDNVLHQVLYTATERYTLRAASYDTNHLTSENHAAPVVHICAVPTPHNVPGGGMCLVWVS